jgi:glycerophosphoryl diester phosphodiesterase
VDRPAGATRNPEPSPVRTPILFAHRGASGLAPENTVEAFRLAVELGATGIETDTWLSVDGMPMLVHDRTYRRPGRRVSVTRSPADAMRVDGIPTLADLYTAVGTERPISIDLQHPEVAGAVIAAAAEVGALARLYTCSGDLALLAAVGRLNATVHVVHSTRRRRVPEGLPARLRALVARRIEVLNMPWRDWTPELVAWTRDVGLRPFAWDAHTLAGMERALDLGVDAIYSDYPDLLVAAAGRRVAAHAARADRTAIGRT